MQKDSTLKLFQTVLRLYYKNGIKYATEFVEKNPTIYQFAHLIFKKEQLQIYKMMKKSQRAKFSKEAQAAKQNLLNRHREIFDKIKIRIERNKQLLQQQTAIKQNEVEINENKAEINENKAEINENKAEINENKADIKEYKEDIEQHDIQNINQDQILNNGQKQ